MVLSSAYPFHDAFSVPTIVIGTRIEIWYDREYLGRLKVAIIREGEYVVRSSRKLV